MGLRSSLDRGHTILLHTYIKWWYAMYVYYILLYNSMLYTKSNTRGFFLGSWLSSNRCLVGIPIYYVPTYGHFNLKISLLIEWIHFSVECGLIKNKDQMISQHQYLYFNIIICFMFSADAKDSTIQFFYP